MREIFRRNRDLFRARPAWVVVNVRAAAANASFAQLSEEYRSIVERALARRR